jgi:hypothetical protein
MSASYWLYLNGEKTSELPYMEEAFAVERAIRAFLDGETNVEVRYKNGYAEAVYPVLAERPVTDEYGNLYDVEADRQYDGVYTPDDLNRVRREANRKRAERIARLTRDELKRLVERLNEVERLGVSMRLLNLSDDALDGYRDAISARILALSTLDPATVELYDAEIDE